MEGTVESSASPQPEPVTTSETMPADLGGTGSAVQTQADPVVLLNPQDRALLLELQGQLQLVLERVAQTPEFPRLMVPGPETAPAAEAGAAIPTRVEAVWATAPLTARLEFLRLVLGDTHQLSGPLKEAVGLSRVWIGSLQEAASWVESYAAVFADAYSGLSRSPAASSAIPTQGEELAFSLLTEVRERLDLRLRELDGEWIVPPPGTAVTSEVSVLGDSDEPGIPPGAVAKCQRRGIRWHGRVHLPAQVFRQRSHDLSPSAVAGPDTWPDWLRTLRTRTTGGTPRVERVVENLVRMHQLLQDPGASGVDDSHLRDLVIPVLDLIQPPADAGPQWHSLVEAVRPGLLRWLAREWRIEVVLPDLKSTFEATEMEAVGTRSTHHTGEWGKVAKVEQVGLRRSGRPLVRARVLRYQIGGLS